MRFPGFQSEWETKHLGDVIEFKAGYAFPSNSMINEKSTYQLIKMSNVYRSELRLDRNPSFWDRVNTKQTEFLLKKGDTILTLTGTVGKKDFGYSVQIDEDDKYLLNQRLVLLREKKGKSVNDFISQVVSNEKFLSDFFETAKGGTGNQTNVGIESIKNLTFCFPIEYEQRKIAAFLKLINQRIQTQNKIIEELKLLKNTIRYRVFQQIRNDGNKFVEIRNILDYEQPNKYLVTNTEYSSDNSLTPVLTANKAFVLGYTNENYGIYNKKECIILDDFTMDTKFVNFPFKVKSSAIKILTPKPNVNLKFIFEYLSFLDLSSIEHKRHYISEIELMEIALPDYTRQKQIAIVLSRIDEKIKTEFDIYALLINQKQYLLQNLFI